MQLYDSLRRVEDIQVQSFVPRSTFVSHSPSVKALLSLNLLEKKLSTYFLTIFEC